MRKRKTICQKEHYMDMEKLQFSFFAWILPLIPMAALFVFGIMHDRYWWALVILAATWLFFGWLFFWAINQKIIVTETGFTVCRLQKKTCYTNEDVALIERVVFLNKPFKKPIYKIYLMENRVLTINNPRIMDSAEIFSGANMKTTNILD